MKINIKVKNRWLAIIVFILASSMFILACNVSSVFQLSTAAPTSSPTLTASPTVTVSPTRTNTPTRTPTQTPTPTSTHSLPSGTPMSLWNHIPIRADALAAEGQPGDRWYSYITDANQDLVINYYLQRLPSIGWEIDWVSPNDHGGYIIYRKNVFDFIYIFEDVDRGVTFVNIFLSTGSPSLNP